MHEIMDIVESDSFHKLLAAFFMGSVCLIAVLYLFINVIRNNFDSKSMKVFGILVISGYALFINHWIIYVLVTLVASTLITIPRFLERILEITFKNQNYSLTPGTESQKVNKSLREVEQFSSAESGVVLPIQTMDSEFNFSITPLEQQVELAISVENKILHVLETEKERLNLKNIKTNQVLTRPNRKSLVLDAILSRDRQHIIMEVQPAIQPDLLYKSIDQLKEQCSYYKKYLRREHIQVEVKGILCTLNYPEFTENLVGGVALLKYDMEKQQFVNLNEVLEWLV